jgi:hypothetical protein
VYNFFFLHFFVFSFFKKKGKKTNIGFILFQNLFSTFTASIGKQILSSFSEFALQFYLDGAV